MVKHDLLARGIAGNVVASTNATLTNYYTKSESDNITNGLDSDITNLETNVTTNYALKSEVTNSLTPKGKIAYASLPTTGNALGDYYYCSDGDGTNGAGNYVWNGTIWYFGGTGDDGYNKLKEDLSIFESSIKKEAIGTSVVVNDSADAPLAKVTIYGTSLQIGTPSPTDKKTINFLVNPTINAWDGVNESTKDILELTYTLRAIGEYKDALEIYADGSGKLTRHIKTGTLHLNSITSHPSGDYGFTDAVYPLVDNTKIMAISDSFIGVKYDDRANNINTFRVATSANTLYFRFATGTIYTLEQAQAIVGGATTYWVSATPEVTNFPVGTFTMVTMQSPKTNVFSTPQASLKLEYYVNVDALINNVALKKIFHVEKDGSGDFIKLVDAINTVSEIMDATLFVGKGTWDIINELGAEYVESVSTTKRGLYLKNRIHIICSSQALITCNYTGTNASTIEWLSAFNTGINGFTLENARIESSNCRYSVHDERDAQTDQYTNKYINCSMKHDHTIKSGTFGGYPQCIGGGLGVDGHVIIEGCIFENPAIISSNKALVSYHNSWGSGRSFVEVKGCYLKGIGNLRFIWFGSSTEITPYLVHDNSLGASIEYHAGSEVPEGENTELLEWNNVVRS